MEEARKIARRRRRRTPVRLRPETGSSEQLDALSEHLGKMLGIGRPRARCLLLQMRPKETAA